MKTFSFLGGSWLHFQIYIMLLSSCSPQLSHLSLCPTPGQIKYFLSRVFALFSLLWNLFSWFFTYLAPFNKEYFFQQFHSRVHNWKKIKRLTWKDIWTPVLIVALWTIVRTQKQFKYTSTDEWIKKMWHIYKSIKTKWYFAICSSMNGLLGHCV